MKKKHRRSGAVAETGSKGANTGENANENTGGVNIDTDEGSDMCADEKNAADIEKVEQAGKSVDNAAGNAAGNVASDGAGDTVDGVVSDGANSGDASGATSEAAQIISELNQKLETAEKQAKEYLDRWQRSAAEFDNYKRRTQGEMERLYTTSAVEVIAVFLPFVDSVERAVGDTGEDVDDPYKEGLILIERQIKDALKKMDVRALPGVGEQFDPNLHEAVMHIEDDSLGQNVIVEVFQHGYIYKEKVVRHSVVKVAN